MSTEVQFVLNLSKCSSSGPAFKCCAMLRCYHPDTQTDQDVGMITPGSALIIRLLHLKFSPESERQVQLHTFCDSRIEAFDNRRDQEVLDGHR